MKKKRKPRAIGLTCGIGSMLIGAKQAGFEIVGNVEWRKYYHTGTFEHNFKKAFMVKSLDELDEIPKNIDLAMGHPECGNFSRLRVTGRSDGLKLDDPGDIPLFTELVSKIKPRFFVMDDLPKSLIPYPIKEWVKALPEYDLFPEWISNYHYGNIQKNRDRFFMIGALKKEKFIFVPGETKHSTTVKDVLNDLLDPKTYGKIPNHHKHTTKTKCGSVNGLNRTKIRKMRVFVGKNKTKFRGTWRDFQKYFEKSPEGHVMQYINADGKTGRRPGISKSYWNGHAHVLDGSSPIVHPFTNLPYNIRERARVQGCPDNFEFIGEKLEPSGMYNHSQNGNLLRQTGKFMPIQFCRYISKQIMARIKNKPFKSSGERVKNHNPNVDLAKKVYCEKVGYRNQKAVCSTCWAPCGMDVPEQPKVKSKASVPLREPKMKKAKPVHYKKPTVKINTQFEKVHLQKSSLPKDYHCSCEYCEKFLGVLIRKDGSYYSKLERRGYYSPNESGCKKSGHIAKTPLHIARYVVQKYTVENDWVLDPTVGSGTTMVEALNFGCNTVGIELETVNLATSNVRLNNPFKKKVLIYKGDAREISTLLKDHRVKFSLVVNNPPYSGDQGQGAGGDISAADANPFDYRYSSKRNIASLNEKKEYWDTMKKIYKECVKRLKPGGHFVIGVKDMMRKKKPYLLHKLFAELLDGLGSLRYCGMVLLPHRPTTLFMNTYPKIHGIPVPLYQTIIIFQKKKGGRKK